MITVTEDAARQITTAATEADAVDLGLRIAVRRDADGTLHYAMGFDETRNDDVVVVSAGIALVVARQHADLLQGMTLDFVEYEPGDHRFIFVNPNDVVAAGAPTSGSASG